MSVIKYLKLHRFLLLAHLVCWHFVHVFLNNCTEKVKEQWFHKIGVESKRAIKCNNLYERVDKIYIWRRFWVAMEAVDGAIETWDPAREGRLVTDCCLICSCMAATISCIWIGKTKITPGECSLSIYRKLRLWARTRVQILPPLLFPSVQPKRSSGWFFC